MAVNKRKTAIYLTAIVVATTVLVAAILASGIQLPTGANKTGTLVVSIKDAPVDLKKLILTIDGLYVLNATDETWTKLSLKEDQPMTFDLLQLTSDNSLQLAEDAIPSGDYSKIRLDITKAVATYIDSKGIEHTDETLNVPPEHIDIITAFTIGDGKVTGVMIDMQPDTAAISQGGNFKPIIKATVTP